jgi:hypothetical protein
MRTSFKTIAAVLLAFMAGGAAVADAQSKSERLFYYVYAV